MAEAVKKYAHINQFAIKGEPGTGFESRKIGGVDKGPFECGNCSFFEGNDRCTQSDMRRKSKRPRWENGDPKVDADDCCEYVDRVGGSK